MTKTGGNLKNKIYFSKLGDIAKHSLFIEVKHFTNFHKTVWAFFFTFSTRILLLLKCDMYIYPKFHNIFHLKIGMFSIMMLNDI